VAQQGGSCNVDAMTWLRAQWDRVAGWALIAVGVVLIILGWQGVSTAPFVADELSYIASAGLGGLLCAGVGTCLLVVAELRDEWRKLDRIEQLLLRQHEAADDEESRPDRAQEPPSEAGRRASNGRGTAPTPKPVPMASRRLDAAAIDPSAQAGAIAGVTVLVAVGVMVIGWHGAAYHGSSTVAVRATAVAVAGLVFGAAGIGGSTLWLKRNVRLRQTRLFAPMVVADAAQRLGQAATASSASSGTTVIVDGPLWHWPGCPDAGETGLARLPLADATRTRAACSICVGDDPPPARR
jgi:hypothetical protein